MLMALINLGMLVVVGRLFQVQILNADFYKSKAKRQHQSRIDLSAQRGNIYDRHGKLLASTIKSISVAVDPNLLKHKQEICDILSESTGIAASKFFEKISRAKGSFVWLTRGLSPDKVFRLRSLNDKGLLLIEEPKRHYHYGGIASQLLGATDIDNKGLTGIELAWDSLLMGRSGYMMMYRDGLGRLRPSADLPIIPALNGYSVQLTLDIELQRIVEFELMQGVTNSQAESGTVIAIKPETGEILAMATYPGFDPNNSSTFTTANMRNKAITDVYEPGSTFKLITAAAAMEEKLVSLSERFNGFNGEMHFSNYVIRDVHPLGIATFREAMIHSSNIILSSVAAKIPDYKFYKYIRDFGFGIVSGIDLPGEIPGRTQRAEQLNISAKRFVGFGYGLLSTPLQIVNSYSAIANKGLMMRPYVVRSVFNSSGEKVSEYSPTSTRRVVSESTAQTLVGVLADVVSKGTGSGAKISGINIAGKTGTSQQLVEGTYSKADYNASFVGFFPAESPKVCMLVFLDRPKTSIYGGSTAAPIFKNIALRWLSVDPSSINYNSNTALSDTVYMPSLMGLLIDDARQIINDVGLTIGKNAKSGIITKQFPIAGTKIKRGTTVVLTTSSPDSLVSVGSNKLPSVVGLSVRRAIAMLHSAGIKAKVKGQGKVVRQIWEKNEKGEIICTLICTS